MSSKSSPAARPSADAPRPGPYLERYAPNRNGYVLSEEGKRLLAPHFKENFNYDPSNIVFVFDHSDVWNGFTPLEGYTKLDTAYWNSRHAGYQLRLIAHEVMHSVQYSRIGELAFWERYAVEHKFDGNYKVPVELWKVPTSKLNPVDRLFTLDQIAERVAWEVAAKGPWP